MRLVKFAFGNTHEEVKKPQPAKSGAAGTQNTHRWCMFVSLNGNPEETQKYIKSVTYHLHPTFRPNKIKVSKAPFLLSRLGWGYFEIEIDIEFQPRTGLGTKRLAHMLNFDGKGKTQSLLLEVAGDGSIGDEALAKALSLELNKLAIKGKK